jgi:putative phosphoesterase
MGSIRLAVVADTHVPDRCRELHPRLIAALREAKVDQIVHAGDISVPRVLRELEAVAPVVAVRGNRDWFPHPDLPLWRILEHGGKRIGLTHGHGGLWPYVGDKLHLLLRGPRAFDHYAQRAIWALPNDVDAVVFGHNHAPMMREIEGKLVFNPGSACRNVVEGHAPSFGVLDVNERGIRGDIVYLE